jgi:S-adenosylmethionine hydrolase
VTEAAQITSSAVVLARPSDTFHGRDVFALAAAHLALGMPIRELGPPIDPQSLIRLDLPRARVSPGQIGTEVLSMDRFGNLQLAARPADLAAAGLEGTVALDVRSGGAIASARRAATFGDVKPGDLALIMDSSGWLALVVNGGSARQTLRLGPGDKVTLSERAR